MFREEMEMPEETKQKKRKKKQKKKKMMTNKWKMKRIKLMKEIK